MRYVNLSPIDHEHTIEIDTPLGRIDLHNDADLTQFTFTNAKLRLEFTQAACPERFALVFSVSRILEMQAEADPTLEEFRLLMNVWIRDLDAEVPLIEIDFGFLAIWLECSEIEFVALPS